MRICIYHSIATGRWRIQCCEHQAPCHDSDQFSPLPLTWACREQVDLQETLTLAGQPQS